MKEGNRVSNNSMKKLLMEAMLLGLKESYEVFSVWLLDEGNCKMKSQPGENPSVLKAVNTQAGYWKAGTVEKRVKNS